MVTDQMSCSVPIKDGHLYVHKDKVGFWMGWCGRFKKIIDRLTTIPDLPKYQYCFGKELGPWPSYSIDGESELFNRL